MIPSGFFNSFDEKTKRLVMLYFSMVSKAAIARVSVEIVFGFEDIKSSAVLSNILFPPFSIPLLISPSVIIPIKLSFSSNTPVIPNPYSDIVKRASFRLVLL